MINMSVSLLENFRECGTFEVCFFFLLGCGLASFSAFLIAHV